MKKNSKQTGAKKPRQLKIRYFIFQEGKLKEVSEDGYETWCSTEEEKYFLPDYTVLSGGYEYAINSFYHGACDQYEMPPLPFVLIYSADRWEITPKGLTKTEEKNEVEFFETPDAMNQRRHELIAWIEARMVTQGDKEGEELIANHKRALNQIAKSLEENKIIALKLQYPEKLKSVLQNKFGINTTYRIKTTGDTARGEEGRMGRVYEFILEG